MFFPTLKERHGIKQHHSGGPFELQLGTIRKSFINNDLQQASNDT